MQQGLVSYFLHARSSSLDMTSDPNVLAATISVVHIPPATTLQRLPDSVGGSSCQSESRRRSYIVDWMQQQGSMCKLFESYEYFLYFCSPCLLSQVCCHCRVHASRQSHHDLHADAGLRGTAWLVLAPQCMTCWASLLHNL